MYEAGELPLTTLKVYKEFHEPGIEEFKEAMQKLFGVDYEVQIDFKNILDEMKKLYLEKDGEERWYGYWPQAVPRNSTEYFSTLARRLKDDNFGTDDMLKEGWTETVDKNIIKFELVPKLGVCPLS